MRWPKTPPRSSSRDQTVPCQDHSGYQPKKQRLFAGEFAFEQVAAFLDVFLRRDEPLITTHGTKFIFANST
ncbi:hypothetical protein [Eastern grey kangaroopox virus]|uniref:Uncharacterized protein n=1 Tax=Eastern grey kangaroopox virus TaxID=2042482 RepID=A0A2C9DSY2_9POXV|nr:hypothetical protein KM541_gp019 [Eastern grey kangaroopox virus]ATI21115.1 hypothetical protein [Eastern grey kangaroopox virus]AXK50163.1 hypothetical protein EKPV-NSW-ORF030 [Eastern grey kangaroopox virus]